MSHHHKALTLGRTGPALYPRLLRVPLDQALTHVHLVGVSGSGKSRFLAALYLSLLRNGIPATLIDPHGDLARLVLGYLVASGAYNTGAGFERVLYLDFPAAERAGRCLPFNVLQTPGSPTTIAGNVLDAFHRAWPALADGAAPRFDKLVTRGIKVLLSNHLPLPMLEALLTSPQLRAQLLANEADAPTAQMFRQQFDRLSLREQIDYADSTLSRISLLTQDPLLNYSLSQPDNQLDFRTILDRNQSLIINLAVQNPGTQRLLGCLLTVAAEQGARSRAELHPGARHGSHHLIIDEFADFVAQSETALSRMLSQTRKFGLFLVMAHQTWSQASERLRGAMQNAGIEVVFRLGRADAEYSAATLGRVNPLAVKHTAPDAAAQERGHPVFYSLPEQWERWVQAIQDLKPRQAFLRLPTGTVRQFTTLAVPNPQVDPKRLAAIEAHYLATYFREQAQVEAQLAQHRPTQPPSPTRSEPLHRRETA